MAMIKNNRIIVLSLSSVLAVSFSLKGESYEDKIQCVDLVNLSLSFIYCH